MNGDYTPQKIEKPDKEAAHGTGEWDIDYSDSIAGSKRSIPIRLRLKLTLESRRLFLLDNFIMFSFIFNDKPALHVQSRLIYNLTF